jgi:hypothetical protein
MRLIGSPDSKQAFSREGELHSTDNGSKPLALCTPGLLFLYGTLQVQLSVEIGAIYMNLQRASNG